MELFSDLNKTDLDDLEIKNPEERAKLLTAAQMLWDYEGMEIVVIFSMKVFPIEFTYLISLIFLPNLPNTSKLSAASITLNFISINFTFGMFKLHFLVFYMKIGL